MILNRNCDVDEPIAIMNEIHKAKLVREFNTSCVTISQAVAFQDWFRRSLDWCTEIPVSYVHLQAVMQDELIKELCDDLHIFQPFFCTRRWSLNIKTVHFRFEEDLFDFKLAYAS